MTRPALAAAAAVAVILGLALALAGCQTSVSPAPAGACQADIRAAGTLPDLEALLPRGMIEAAPTTVDSGLNCTNEALGSYRQHGIREIRFAGATWDYGDGNATVVAVVTSLPVGQPLLEAAWVEEFYLAGALSGRQKDIETSRPNVPGVGTVFRIEALNNLSLQTVVVWPAETYVHVVIVATEVGPDANRADHDERVRIAVEVANATPP